MENGQNMQAFFPQGSGIVGPSHGRGYRKGHNDLADRRLKNRERQRRYRERKRLEAEARRASSTTTPSAPQPTEVHLNGFSEGYANRVYCCRDWKKDARRAYASHEPNVTTSHGPTIASGNEIAGLRSETATVPPLDPQLPSETSHGQTNAVTRRIVQCRRDWKAEARNKKS